MIRSEVNAELARLIAGSGVVGGATVSAYYPGEKHLTREMVFGSGTSGGVGFPYAMSGDRIQRDLFSVLWVVRVTATDGLDKAMVRRDELANEIAFILAGADLLAFSTDTEKVTDTNPDGQSIQVETREGDDPKTGVPVAIAEITVPIETQTTEG